MTPADAPLAFLARLLDRAGLAHALIGGHAVNVHTPTEDAKARAITRRG